MASARTCPEVLHHPDHRRVGIDPADPPSYAHDTQNGSLGDYFSPNISWQEQMVAGVEGWILGVM